MDQTPQPTEYHADLEYFRLAKEILSKGTRVPNRTGKDTISIFGGQMRFDLQKGFPLLTTKKVSWKLISTELLWFIAGDTRLRTLLAESNHIWDEWPFKRWMLATGQTLPDQKSDTWKESMKTFREKILTDDAFSNEYGDLGPIYGYQWRHWPNHRGGFIDQLSNVIADIKKDPNSRRHIVTAWNPSDIAEMAIAGLPPCHCLFQFKVIDEKLSCHLYQRSCDFFLGVPFNIASYSLLTHMIAHATNLEVGDFVWTGGDIHFYVDHLDQIKEQMTREPKKMPTLTIEPSIRDIFALKKEHLILTEYDPHPAIKGEIAV